nr:2-oxoacid:acceptor oxidoreductase family protein [Conexibacter sp. S30A1]
MTDQHPPERLKRGTGETRLKQDKQLVQRRWDAEHRRQPPREAAQRASPWPRRTGYVDSNRFRASRRCSFPDTAPTGHTSPPRPRPPPPATPLCRYRPKSAKPESERTGAPVVSFCRIDDRVIRTREPITDPDAVIVVDPTLLHHVDVFGGLKAGGYVLINSSRSVDELGIESLNETAPGVTLLTVPATELAREHLGRPLPNAALLGAFAALTGVVSVDSVAAAIRERFSGETGEANVRAARAAAGFVAPSSGKAPQEERLNA